MTAYRVQGSTASIVPYRQIWQDSVYGIDATGAPIVGAFKTARLDYDAMTYASAQQWLQFCNTGTSLVTATILNLDGTSFVALSGIFFNLGTRPTFESGYVGPFSIEVTRALP